MKSLPKWFYVLFAGCLMSACASTEKAPPHRLQVENRTAPLGIDVSQPRFSWWLDDTSAGAVQTAYELRIAEVPPVALPREKPWSSGIISSAQSVGVVAPEFDAKPATRYAWQVRAWDGKGVASTWSAPAHFETGLMDNIAWERSRWIGHPPRDNAQSVPAAYLRTRFAVAKPVVRARLYATARGLFEIWINGRRVGEDYFTPGWTDYAKTNQYLTYDVTPLLQAGVNGIGAILGEGWYAGRLMSGGGRKNQYGTEPALRLRLDVTYADGTASSLFSDDTWRVTTGPILSSDIYNGESYDARRELGDWSAAAHDISAWNAVQVFPDGREKLVAKISQPVRHSETLKPLSVTRAKNGEWVFDFGQNMVGIPRLKLAGEKGRTVTLRFAEMLNDDGTLYVENLRRARATDTYTFGENGTAAWTPAFTFHGFRYIGLGGVEEAPALDSLEGLVLHNDMPRTGAFTCSDPIINRLQSNIVWGQRGNFFEVPTDCPQRDERFGWMGDAQIFARTATFNYDVRAFFDKWMQDVRDAQRPDGSVPGVAPAPHWGEHGSAAWADAVAIVPWVMYQQYGDRRILAENYEAMRGWVEYMRKTAPEGIRPEEGFGDWLALDRPGNPAPHETDTPKALVGTAYFARSADILARTAAVLGKAEDAAKYRELRDFVRDAFVKKFVAPDGKIQGHTQSVYLLALAFDLLPENLRAAATENLVNDIRARDWHLSTGFVGTGILMPTLDAIGRQDVAFKLLKQETYPGWLYSIRQGATTMWERWNSYTKDKGFGPVSMNSFNHYAYGAVGEWIYARIGGLSALEPGFKKSRIAPVPGGGITHATCALDTPYGRLSCAWRLVGDSFEMQAEVPPNTTATVMLPNGETREVLSGKHSFGIVWPGKK